MKIMSRKEYTRHQIKEALLMLLKKESFEKNTVSQLSKTAGITRATFYLHYTNPMDVIDELLEDAIMAAGDNDVEDDNLAQITKALNRAKTGDELYAAYESVFSRLPLCQRVSGERKYMPIFKDVLLAEHIIYNLYFNERPKQVAALTKELKVTEAVADAIFLFCVHGLYAINQKYNWQRTEEWLMAQRALFQFMQSGMQGVAQNRN